MHYCDGSLWWVKLLARAFQRNGHAVKLISLQFVRPFVKTNKNDANDAEAIVEAASRPSMHFVPIKQIEQQDIQSLHRVLSRIVKNRTALINEIRRLNLASRLGRFRPNTALWSRQIDYWTVPKKDRLF